MRKTINFKGVVDERFEYANLLGREPKNKSYPIQVDISDIKETSENVTFKANVPDHIFEAVLNSSPEYIGDKFTKRVSSYTLCGLIEKMVKISNDALIVKYTERANMPKVILLRFNSKIGERYNNWAGGSEGYGADLMFQYIVCYKGSMEYYTNKRHGEEPTSRRIRIGKLKEYTEMQWSQEREDFCENLYQLFVKQKERIEAFMGNINNDTIDNLIASHSQILLS